MPNHNLSQYRRQNSEARIQGAGYHIQVCTHKQARDQAYIYRSSKEQSSQKREIKNNTSFIKQTLYKYR